MVEFVGALPLLAIGALACVQALLVACALLFAQTAADRAARGAPRAQVTAAVPHAWRSKLSVTRSAGSVRVRVTPPAVLPGAGSRLRVSASSQELPA